ncbi:hypothetical protein Zmor_011945 [Zophobas morio]|uniref:Uncharacterized protein n=1 Tax=Zophobas morio TaxID=2755281 RepID=A0AA38LYN2_9CUCU|nr:hypothetical protein Zmor_011945 [Zophobas morio]
MLGGNQDERDVSHASRQAVHLKPLSDDADLAHETREDPGQTEPSRDNLKHGETITDGKMLSRFVIVAENWALGAADSPEGGGGCLFFLSVAAWGGKRRRRREVISASINRMQI